MKYQMKGWQLIVGCLVCLGIFLSMFMPRITITSGRWADWSIGILEDAADWYQEKTESEWADLIGDSLGDRREDIKEDADKLFKNKKINRSSAQLIFAGKEGVYEFLQDITGESEGKFDELDENEKKLVDEIYGALLLPRIMLAIIYILPILLIALYLITYLKGWKKTVAVISTWVYFLLAAASNFAWYIFIPSIGGGRLADVLSKSAKELDFGYSIFKGSIDDMITSGIRRMLVSFTGFGIWFFAICSVLLLAYSFLLMLTKGMAPVGVWDEGGYSGAYDVGVAGDNPWNQNQYNQIQYNAGGNAGNALGGDGVPMGDGYQDIPIMEDNGRQNANMVTRYGEETYPLSQAMGNKRGRIRITRGTMAGAEIVCTPGEQIVVGRDPSVSDLVLSHRKVSRKHFVICYNQETDQFDIFCFSENGINLSGGRRIGKGQHASLDRGMGILIADGEETMNLE